MCMCALLLQSCLTLCDPMDCSPPGSSVHGILQASILEWVAMPFSRGSSLPRDQTSVSCIGRWILYHCTTWEALSSQSPWILLNCPLCKLPWGFRWEKLFISLPLLSSSHFCAMFQPQFKRWYVLSTLNWPQRTLGGDSGLHASLGLSISAVHWGCFKSWASGI